VSAWWITWWGLLGAWVLGLVIALPVQAMAVGGEWRALLGDSRWGTAWVGLAVLAVVGGLASAAARRADEPLAPSGTRMYALAIPGVIGAMMAMEAVKYLTGAGETLSGRLMIHDALYAETRVIAIKPRADCPVCGTHSDAMAS
jgi:hypothetical protein